MKNVILTIASVVAITGFNAVKIFAAGEGTEETPAAETGTTPTTPTTTTTPAAGADSTAKKTKKKKKKAATGAAGDAAANGEASSGHGAQQSGAPYKANVDLDLGFNSQSSNTKYKDTTSKSTSTSLSLDVSWLFVFGHMEAGPQISFSSTSTKAGSSSTATKSGNIGIGGAFYYNLGNINTDKNVPYAGASLLRNSITSDDGSSKSTYTTIELGLEGGMKYFVGAHLALKPFLSYDLTMNGESKLETNGSSTVGSVSGSNLKLGLGLAKYF